MPNILFRITSVCLYSALRSLIENKIVRDIAVVGCSDTNAVIVSKDNYCLGVADTRLTRLFKQKKPKGLNS